MIAVFLSPLYLILNGYLVFRMLRWFASLYGVLGKPCFVIPFFIFYLLLCLSPLAAVLLRGFPRSVARRISNCWLGILMYLLILLLAADLSWIIYRLLSHQNPLCLPDSSFTRIAGSIVFAGVLGISAYGLRHASHLKHTRYQVSIKKPSALSQLRIALAADLHLGTNTDIRMIHQTVDMINSIQPDLIIFAGDMFDNDFNAIREPEKILCALRRMKSTYGAWACWGNHDIDEMILAGFTFSSKDETIGSDPRMDQFLEAAGIRLLEDETVQIGRSFTLTGRLDRSCLEKSGKIRKTPKELATGVDLTLPAIVIDHQPAEFEALASAGFDLDLSGHTHDGQLFPATIFTRLGWKNSYGMKRFHSLTSIVTSGAGVWGPMMRVGTSNEVVEILVNFGLDEQP